MKPKISVQINLAASDHAIAGLLLERQVALLSPFVDEVVLTLDTKVGLGRFAESWAKGKALIDKQIEAVLTKYPTCRVDPVDYDPATQKKVADFFGQSEALSLSDYRGAPVYVYFYGLYGCKNDLVFHIDGDMVLGGDLETWFEAAVDELKSASILSASPLPGPPTSDGHLKQDSLNADPAARRYEFSGFSTRVFFMNRRALKNINFAQKVTGLKRLKSLWLPYKPNKATEVIITDHMHQHAQRRVDFGGQGQFYSLHPNYKSQSFYAALPAILKRLDAGDIPEAQQGDYEFSDSFHDFAPDRAAEAATRWKRILGLR